MTVEMTSRRRAVVFRAMAAAVAAAAPNTVILERVILEAGEVGDGRAS
jgi:hypothetical protein